MGDRKKYQKTKQAAPGGSPSKFADGPVTVVPPHKLKQEANTAEERVTRLFINRMDLNWLFLNRLFFTRMDLKRLFFNQLFFIRIVFNRMFLNRFPGGQNPENPPRRKWAALRGPIFSQNGEAGITKMKPHDNSE